jgi:hypothetical protein
MKNNAFKKTFYFGLIILLFFVGVISLITVNVFRLTSKHDDKLNDIVDSTEYKQIDTIDRNYIQPTIVVDMVKPITFIKERNNMVNKTDTTVVTPDTIIVVPDTIN